MRLGGKSKELGQHLFPDKIRDKTLSETKNYQITSNNLANNISNQSFISFSLPPKIKKKENLSYIQVVNPSINYIEKERSNAYIFELAKRIRIIRE